MGRASKEVFGAVGVIGLSTEITYMEGYHVAGKITSMGEEDMATSSQFNNPENDRALNWLTTAGSIQAAQLEHAMRNYEQPVYDPADVGRHLMKVLSLPMAGYTGDASKVDAIPLAIAIISHASIKGWDVVEEIGRM